MKSWRRITAVISAVCMIFQYTDFDFAAYFDSTNYHIVTFVSDSEGCVLKPGIEEDPDFAEAGGYPDDAADGYSATPSDAVTPSDAATLSDAGMPPALATTSDTGQLSDAWINDEAAAPETASASEAVPAADGHRASPSVPENQMREIRICVPDGECIAFNEVPEPVLQKGYKFTGWSSRQDVYDADEILDIPVNEDMTFTAEIEEPPALFEQTLTAYAGNQIITVTGLLPEGAEVLAEQIPLQEAQRIVTDETGEAQPEICFALDISILVNGEKYQPEDYGDSVTVSVRNLEITEGQEISVLHVKEDAGVETLAAEKGKDGSGDSATFTAQSFSIYIGTSTPSTGLSGNDKAIYYNLGYFYSDPTYDEYHQLFKETGGNSPFTKIQDVINAFDGTGLTIYMMSQYSVDGENIDGGTKGITLKYPAGVEIHYNMLWVTGTSSLQNITLDGNSENGTLMRRGTGNTDTSAVVVPNTGNLTLETGTVIQRFNSSSNWDSDADGVLSGVAVYVGGGKLTMNGGVMIQHNMSPGFGAIYICGNGSAVMNEGSILYNYIRCGGSAVMVDTGSTFTMNGGTISGNRSNTGTILGWADRVNKAIYNNGVTININGGSISQNYANWMGGVALFYRKTSAYDCSGVKLNISGGTISDNTAGFYGSEIGEYFTTEGLEGGSGPAMLTMGSPEVNITGGTFSGKSSNDNMGMYFRNAKVTLGNSAPISISERVVFENTKQAAYAGGKFFVASSGFTLAPGCTAIPVAVTDPYDGRVVVQYATSGAADKTKFSMSGYRLFNDTAGTNVVMYNLTSITGASNFLVKNGSNEISVTATDTSFPATGIQKPAQTTYSAVPASGSGTTYTATSANIDGSTVRLNFKNILCGQYYLQINGDNSSTPFTVSTWELQAPSGGDTTLTAKSAADAATLASDTVNLVIYNGSSAPENLTLAKPSLQLDGTAVTLQAKTIIDENKTSQLSSYAMNNFAVQVNGTDFVANTSGTYTVPASGSLTLPVTLYNANAISETKSGFLKFSTVTLNGSSVAGGISVPFATQASNLSATVPIKVTAAVKADGTVVAPGSDSYKIQSTTPAPIKIASVKWDKSTSISSLTAPDNLTVTLNNSALSNGVLTAVSGDGLQTSANGTIPLNLTISLGDGNYLTTAEEFQIGTLMYTIAYQ